MSIILKSLASNSEIENRNEAINLFKNNPIPDNEKIANVGIFQKRQDFTKQLFFNEIYKEILNVHGIIIEFGVRWGQNLVTLNNLRGIHEPYNYSRKIVGFDSFEGFPSVDEKDGHHDSIQKGAFSVTENYEIYLEKLLNYHEKEAPLNHIKKNTILKGDAPLLLEKYLADHPETIIAFAYFDFDIYEPTLKCLELIKPYLTKGSIIGFDELNDPQFPGETLALKEVFKFKNIKIKRNKFSGIQSYFKVK